MWAHMWAAGYVLVALLFFVAIYAQLYIHERPNWGTGDRVFVTLWGSVVAFFWPITLPINLLILLIIFPLKSVYLALEDEIERRFH